MNIVTNIKTGGGLDSSFDNDDKSPIGEHRSSVEYLGDTRSLSNQSRNISQAGLDNDSDYNLPNIKELDDQECESVDLSLESRLDKEIRTND